MDALPTELLVNIFCYLPEGSNVLRAKLLSSRCDKTIKRYWDTMNTKVTVDLEIQDDTITVVRPRISAVVKIDTVNGSAQWMNRNGLQWDAIKDGDVQSFFDTLARNVEINKIHAKEFDPLVLQIVIENMLRLNINAPRFTVKANSRYLGHHFDLDHLMALDVLLGRYSAKQWIPMEKTFQRSQYPGPQAIQQLAAETGMRDFRIQGWFRHRRELARGTE